MASEFIPLSPTCGHCTERGGTCFPEPCRHFLARQEWAAATSPGLNLPSRPLAEVLLNRARQALHAIARTSTDPDSREAADKALRASEPGDGGGEVPCG